MSADFLSSYNKRFQSRCIRRKLNTNLPSGVVVNCHDSFSLSGCGVGKINSEWKEIHLVNAENNLKFKSRIKERTQGFIFFTPINFTGSAAELYIKPISSTTENNFIFGRILVVSRDIWKIIQNNKGKTRFNLLQKHIDSDPAIYELLISYGVLEESDGRF